jgi:hypothetical protein
MLHFTFNHHAVASKLLCKMAYIHEFVDQYIKLPKPKMAIQHSRVHSLSTVPTGLLVTA